MAWGRTPGCHRPRAVKRGAQVLAVQQRYQLQFVGVNRRRLIIERGAVEPQQLALPAERQRAGSFHHRHPPLTRYSPDLRNKKSRSTISRPTCSYSSASLRSLTSSLRPSRAENTLGAASVRAFFQAYIWFG